LLSSFPKSEFVEMAYIGLGEIALARQNWQVAYQWFKDAIDVAGASYKTKEAVFGQARSLMELGKLPEAKKLFEQVASTREWRGEITAKSVLNLGEIEFRQQKWNEAIAYYQRVFVSYQKYLVPSARAYLQSARAFDKLGKRPEAVTTLGEMLRNTKIPQGYRDEARKLLKEWRVE
jgi:TolA-binding protein